MTFEEGRLFVLLKVILCFLASDFSYPVFFFFFPKELSYACLCNHSDVRGVRRGQS